MAHGSKVKYVDMGAKCVDEPPCCARRHRGLSRQRPLDAWGTTLDGLRGIDGEVDTWLKWSTCLGVELMCLISQDAGQIISALKEFTSC